MGDLDLFGQPGSAQDHAWSVLDVTRRAKQLVESGFTRLWVRGELTGFKAYQSGHWYFSLRDAQAQVRCIMWRSDAQRVPTPPADGLDVFVEGQPTVWEERGEFRLVVRSLLPTKAAGLWEVQFQQAKAALARDGLLDPARKRPLPAFPRRIAVVTSQDGAALRDILSVLRRRWPSTEVLLLPSRVQGDGAEEELCRALALVNRLEDVDLAIVGRGGGSREDLWAFNRESVARAVAAVRVPVVSAVGHETDVALTDLVADLRAPTPSAAAEAAVPNVTDVRADVERLAVSLGNALRSRTRLGHERLARTGDLLSAEMQVILHRRRARVDQLARALSALSPLAVLARGYAIARDEQGRLLRRREQFPPDLDFTLTLSDGTVPGRVRKA